SGCAADRSRSRWSPSSRRRPPQTPPDVRAQRAETARRPSFAAAMALVFLPFAAGYFFSYLFRSVNAVVAPHLVAAVDADPAELGLLSAAYLIAFAAMQIPLGVMLDRFGPRRMLGALYVVAAV